MALYPPAPVESRRTGQRPHKVLLPLALPFVVLAGVAVFGVLTPYHQASAPPPGRPGALVWGNGIFANSFELKAWLGQQAPPTPCGCATTPSPSSS